MSLQPPSIRIRAQDFPEGISRAEHVDQLGQLLNPLFKFLSTLSANGVSVSDHLQVETQTLTLSHGVAAPVTLKTLTSAKGALVMGSDQALVRSLKVVPIATPAPDAATTLQVTAYFDNPTVANAQVKVMFTPEGQLSTGNPVPTMIPLNVMDFGARGNGVNDDSLALANAIASLPSTGGVVDCRSCRGGMILTSITISRSGVKILWPAAQITLGTHPITISPGAHNVCLIGAASYGSPSGLTVAGTYFVYSGTGTAIVVGDTSADTIGFQFQDATIDIHGAGSSAIGLQLNRAISFNLVRPRIRGTSGGGTTQVLLDLQGSTNYTGGTVLAPYFSNGDQHVRLGQNANASQFFGGEYAAQNATYCFNFAGTVTATAGGNQVYGGDIEGCTTAFHFDHAGDNQILGARIEAVTNYAVTTANSLENSAFVTGAAAAFAITDLGSNNSFADTFSTQIGRALWVMKNTNDAASILKLYSGLTVAQNIDIVLRDAVAGTDTWTLRKTAANFFDILRSSGVGRMHLGSADSHFSAEGAGIVQHNMLPNSGTGGTIFGSGGASPAQVASVTAAGAIRPGTPAGAVQTGQIWMGSGVPSNANGNDGDAYIRTDTPGTVTQRLYMKSAGAWIATAA